MISIPLDHDISAPGLMSLDMFQYLLVYSLWEFEYNLYPTVIFKKFIQSVKETEIHAFRKLCSGHQFSFPTSILP